MTAPHPTPKEIRRGPGYAQTSAGSPPLCVCGDLSLVSYKNLYSLKDTKFFIYTFDLEDYRTLS